VKRLFFAIDLSEDLLNSLKSRFWYWRDDLLADFPIKWVDPEQWHLTLVFLGDQNEHSEEVIISVTNEILWSQCRGQARGMGIFERAGEIQTIYLPVAGSQLEENQLILRESLGINGIKFDQKPWRAHITLGRVKKSLSREQDERVRQLIESVKNTEWGDLDTENIVLYSSVLTNSGPIYQIEEKFYVG